MAAVGVHLVWYLFVNTPTGQAIDRAAFEGALIQQTRLWQIGRPVLDVVSTTLVGLSAVAAVLIAMLRRRAWLAIQALIVVVGANATTQLVKDLYARPRLLPVWTGQNSLPSGHTTVVAAASVAMLLTVPRRWRPVVAVVGAIWTVLTGLSTLVGRWHRPADVVAALLVVCFWGAIACSVGSHRSLDSPSRIWPTTIKVTSIALGGLALVSTVFAIAALTRLYSMLSTAGSADNLITDLLESGELTAYIGGVAAVVASIFGVFSVLLWLRQTTLTADNLPLVGYGASLAPETTPQITMPEPSSNEA